MSDRSYHSPQTQGVRHVTYHFSAAAASVATNAPTFVEGDTSSSGAATTVTGSYVVMSKVATGKYRFKTKDPFKGCVGATVDCAYATPTGNHNYEVLKPTQNSDGTWQFEVWTYVNAAGTYTLTDMTSGDLFQIDWTLRNSSVTP